MALKWGQDMEGDVAAKASHPSTHAAEHGKPAVQGKPMPRLPHGVKLTPAQVRELEERPDPFLDPWEEGDDATDAEP